MAEISKQALKVDNNQSFPNNNNGAITPSILRAFNVNMIDSMVDEITYNVDSASWNVSIDNIEAFTSSLQTAFVSTASFNAYTQSINAYTASNNTKWNNAEVATSSLFTSVDNLNQFTASQVSAFNELNAWSASAKVSIGALNQASSSLQSFTQSANVSITNLNTTTASLNTSVSNINTFTASAGISINALNVSSASQQVSIDSLNSKTGSYATTGSNTFTSANTFTSISASSFVSASEFIGNGAKITGITASIALPILDEGIPQGNAFSMNFTGSGISAVVVGGTAVVSVNTPDSGTVNNLTASFNAYTSSTNLDLAAIHQATASLQQFTASFSTSSLVSTSSFNAYTASNDQRVTSLETNSASVNTSITNINSATASLFTSASLALVTASVNNDDITFTKGDGSQFTIQVATGSFAISASYAETASYAQFATDIYLNVKNTTGAQLNKGTVVRIIGATGDNALIATASWTNDANSANTLGLLYENIANDSFGKAITQGTLLGIDTDPALGYTAGQLLYLSSSGQYTNVKPDAPYHEVRLGQVLRAQQNNGSMYVLIQNGYELDELHDVDINTGSLANNDLLAWDSASQQWTNKTVSGVGATTTSSFNSYTASNDQKVDSLIAATGSYATTGSNVFTGDQTLIDAAGNTITLSDVSGSLMLVAKGFTSASAHFSASASNQVNLIFKNNNNTADTVISGSNNIFTAFAAPTAGFKRYIGGTSNYFTNTFGPQISGSMQFSPSMNRNIGGNVFTIRGPVSSSGWTMNENYVAGNVNLGTDEGTSSFEKMVSGYGFTQNGIFGGTINITAGKTKLDTAPTMNSNLIFGAALNINHNSSSMNYNSNIQNGGITINNNYISASGATTVPTRGVSANVNTVYGVNHGVTFGGSNVSTNRVRTWFANLMAGANISASLEETADNSSMVAVNMLGNGLIVSASSTSPTAIPVTTTDGTYGSVFAGRFNSTDGARAKTAETVFAIGTGTSYANRKTGFLIDSGSNTFVEGTLNVSGATSLNGDLNITGSLTASLQEGYVWVGNASGITTTVSTSSFGGTLPNDLISSSAQITALGFVSSSVTASSIVTASVSLNTITFTKGDASTFALTVDTGSGGGGAAFPYTGSAQITGSLGITGSLNSLPITLSVASSTASIDMAAGNQFVLTLPSGSTTHIAPTSIIAGQTINLLIKQQVGPATGSIAFAPSILFPSGLDMQATATGSAIDLVSMISFDTTNLIAANVKNLR